MSKNKNKNKNSKGLTKQEKEEVKKIMSEKDENKIVSRDNPLTQHNSAISAGDLIPIIPRMTQGTAEGQRVGNEVVIKNLYVRGLLNLTYNGSINRSKVGVRVFIFSVKGYASSSAAISASSQWIDGFLRDGTNVRSFDGTVKSYFLPVNTDLITVHEDQRHAMTMPFQLNTGISPDSTSYPVQTQYSYRYWTARLKCKNKKLKYSSITAGGGIDQTPNNYGPILAIGYCKLNGSGPDVLDTGVSSETMSIMEYEDA